MDGSDDVEDECDPADESDAPELSTVTETRTPTTPTSKIQGGPLKKGNYGFHAIPISEFLAQKKKKKPPLNQEN